MPGNPRSPCLEARATLATTAKRLPRPLDSTSAGLGQTAASREMESRWCAQNLRGCVSELVAVRDTGAVVNSPAVCAL